MPKINNLEKYYQEAEKRFKLRKLVFDSDELKKSVDDMCRQADESYLKLSKPRTCSRHIYQSIWINEDIGNLIAVKGVGEPIQLDNPPENFRASTDFYLSYPWGTIKPGIDLEILEKKWLAMVRERIQFSIDKGYKSRLDMYLHNFVIPKKEYDKFLQKAEGEISDRCYICEIENFPFKTNEELISLFGNINKDKLKFELGDKSETKYIKEQDYFVIRLNKNLNEKHRMMDLIHELAHVESMLAGFKSKDFAWRGAYFWEKKAIEIELRVLKKYFPVLFEAQKNYVKQLVRKTLFEIEVFNDPDVDLDNAWGVGDKSYLLDNDIMYDNFKYLVYAVGYMNCYAKFI